LFDPRVPAICDRVDSVPCFPNHRLSPGAQETGKCNRDNQREKCNKHSNAEQCSVTSSPSHFRPPTRDYEEIRLLDLGFSVKNLVATGAQLRDLRFQLSASSAWHD